MNCKFIKSSLLVVSASVLFLAGCGPQDINDPEYLAQINDDNILNKEAQDMNAADQAPAEKGGCPVGGGCATGNCETPPDPSTERSVQLPDVMKVEPTRITRTGERQDNVHVINQHQTTHIQQPHVREHTTHKHTTTITRFHPKEVFHPSTRRVNILTRSASAENVVMPVQREVAPLVDHGCAAPAPVVAVRPVVLVRPVPVYPAYGRWGW